MERTELSTVIYEKEGPIARIVLNRPERANAKDSAMAHDIDDCLHDADRDTSVKVVILKANGKGFCSGHAVGGAEDSYPEFGHTPEQQLKGSADLFLWPVLYLWEFPKPTIAQVHGYCIGGGTYLGLLTDITICSDDAYFQMPLVHSLGEPGGHTMIEPWLFMNWKRAYEYFYMAPTISAAEAKSMGMVNDVVPRSDLEATVERWAETIAAAPLTTLMAVKSGVKKAWEHMGMRIHVQNSHLYTNFMGVAHDVQELRKELMSSGMKPREWVERRVRPAPDGSES